MVDQVVVFLSKLVAYPLLLIGFISFLGAIYSWCRYNKCIPWLAKACNAKLVLGLAAVLLACLLARTMTPERDSLWDYASFAAYGAVLFYGGREVYVNREAIKAWVLSKTMGGDGQC